jgi:hypothetical protein
MDAQMPEPTKILSVVLSTYERSGWVCKELAELIANVDLIPGHYATRFSFAHNFMPAAAARNAICKQVLSMEDRPDWLLMIDNDMAPKMDLYSTIEGAPAEADIVVPAFYMWDNGKKTCTLCWGKDDMADRGEFGPGFHHLTKCGTGAIFIRPRILEKLTYPYFHYVYNENGGMEGTEDIQFCLKVNKAAGQIWGNASVMVGHWRTVDLAAVASVLYDNISIDKAKEASVKGFQGNGRSPEPAVVACSAPAEVPT